LTTTLLDHPTRLVDAASFLSAYRSIFEDEIYSFEPSGQSPVIIDGGANVGLATLYWKKRWPDAEIIAFEPDPQVFEVLEWNCKEHGHSGVTLIQKGLWSEETTLRFHSDGADAGHVEDMHGEDARNCAGDKSDSNDEVTRVPVVRLTEYLHRPVDLLKLDIEGAETEVLTDCQDLLVNVEHLFVEYHSFVGKEQRLDELLHVLRDADFRIHAQPELVAERPFEQRPDDAGMDHRLNIFAFRI
jgi:FkbM family methyltransferase